MLEKEDARLKRSEFVNILDKRGGSHVLTKVFWLNPPGAWSSCMETHVTLMDGEGRLEPRSAVTGFRCGECGRTFFAADFKGLRHAPCCCEEADEANTVECSRL